ncbi:MAG: TIGR03279 family radical SAM protein [Cyanobacteria bacterium SID2]|nr:TIGR03279 family radical SAM protein [Cyanobacteria bacterium SID2]MBP0003903.1 TIGR03279 family radical SAM protein [Cyanobacteria bacterium SBC]
MSRSTIQPALVTQVLPSSIAEEIGFEPGDRLVSINGMAPRDLIDYQFLCADEFLTLEVLDANGERHEVEIEKDYDDDLGLEFESALFDGLIQCNNRCPFCFIDQKPPGMRDTLYLKDDDYRLSFLYGSYLTLTNLPPAEWERIEQMRLSPLYVSVHATEADVRSRLLKNPRAGLILEQLQWFQTRRLQIHAQVVVCPGINDGAHLDRTLRDLAKFGGGEVPAVASVAVVPVGLTRFRPPEDELVPVSPADAKATIEQVQTRQNEFRQQLGSTFAWLADEWFLIAGLEMPATEDYEDYPQIDNGVGSIRLFLDRFAEEADRLLPDTVLPPRRLTWVVGNAVRTAFDEILDRLNCVNGLNVEMLPLNSDFWGQDISVTGVLTGIDVVRGLRDREVGDAIVLPTVMLKHGETRFLDDVTVADIEREFGVPVLLANDTEGFIQCCLSEIPVLVKG